MADDVVTLRFPASTDRVRLARVLVAALGDDAGFDYDEVEDLRIAVDELCFVLIELCRGDAVIELTATTEPGNIVVEGRCAQGADAGEHAGPSELTAQILRTVVDSYELGLVGDSPHFRFTKSKP